MEENKNISNLSEDSGKGHSLIGSKNEILSQKYFLKGKTIGISISESENLAELGYGVSHLKDAIIETARYVLAMGGKLAYGGDMRPGGFTELLFELLAYYKADKELLPNERFYSYLAYPISTTLSKEKEAELKPNVTFKKISPPDNIAIPNANEFLKPDSPENLYIWARCLTKMREEMESNCNARIFIGGKTKGYNGKYPGIFEEFLIAMQKKHPVYLVGAFGGATREIIKALNNEESESFTNEFHLKSVNYKGFFDLYNQKHQESKIDYKGLFSSIQTVGMKGIAKMNGLSEAENLRLAVSPHISEIIYLVLKGLTNCSEV